MPAPLEPEDRQNLLHPYSLSASSRQHSAASTPTMKFTSTARPSGKRSNKITIVQILSYALDWVILIAVGVVGTILGNISPNMRTFSLQDLNISYVGLGLHYCQSHYADTPVYRPRYIGNLLPRKRQSTPFGY